MDGMRSRLIVRKAAFALPFFLLASAAAVNPAKAAPETLEAISPWQVERHAESCALSGAFGSEKDPLVLHFERFRPMHDFQLMLIGKRMEGFKPPQPLRIQYGIGKTQTTTTYRPARTAGGRPVIFVPVSAVPHDNETTEAVTAGEAAVSQIILGLPNDKEFIVQTDSLGEPFVAFQTCTEQLVKLWGYDPDQQKRLSRRLQPMTSPATWVQGADYPQTALTNLMQAMVNFRLDVDPSGVPTKCVVQRSIGKQFDQTTCNLLMRRARFEPALDQDDKPVSSFFASSVNWTIP